MDVTKPYKFIWVGDIHGPKPYESSGRRWASILQTRHTRGRHVVGALNVGTGRDWNASPSGYLKAIWPDLLAQRKGLRIGLPG